MDLSIEDFLSGVELRSDYSAWSGYQAFNALIGSDFDSLKSVSNQFGVSYGAVKTWARGLKKPVYVKKVDSLIDRGLLPYDGDSMVDELFLYVLFSGGLYQTGNNFSFRLRNKPCVLKQNLVELNDYFCGLNTDLDDVLCESSFGAFELLITSVDYSNDPIAPALGSLLFSLGCLVDNKMDQLLPDLSVFDPELVIYSSFMLKGGVYDGGERVEIAFRSSYDEQIAKSNVDGLLSVVESLGFGFTGYPHRFVIDSHEIFTPTLYLRNKAGVSCFKNFINGFSSKLTFK